MVAASYRWFAGESRVVAGPSRTASGRGGRLHTVTGWQQGRCRRSPCGRRWSRCGRCSGCAGDRGAAGARPRPHPRTPPARRILPVAPSDRRRPAALTGARQAPHRTPDRENPVGRLTGFRTHARNFSANFLKVCIIRPKYPSPPDRPARKGSRTACAPYGDWPLRQGALPCAAVECHAS